jgi:predicted TPR repeat methyltransferase
MTTQSGESLPPGFFDAIYAEAPDPWSFATSAYEHEKYATTVGELPRARYQSAFEIGCSVGVLTERLAVRCDALMSVDVVERALAQARSRCAHLPHVRFQKLRVPETFPDASFDLIVVSEVGYYWSLDDLARSRDLIVEHLTPGGHLILVHFTNEVADYPISGDTVHEVFFGRAGDASDAALRHVRGRRERRGDFGFRLDLFERR